MGRRRLDELSGAVRRTEPVDAEWRFIRFHVFELSAGERTFEQRIDKLKTLASDIIAPVKRQRFTSNAELWAKLKPVVDAGSEGLMLHRADAPLAEVEAVVVGHETGKARYVGQLGALELQTTEGVRFKLGSGLTDAQRRDPPPIGVTVAYRNRYLAPLGKPHFASVVRVADEF